MARPPSSEQVQVNFRMPADLKARIEAAAEERSRSTTAEIVATLEEAYPPPPSPWSELAEQLQRYLTTYRKDHPRKAGKRVFLSYNSDPDLEGQAVWKLRTWNFDAQLGGKEEPDVVVYDQVTGQTAGFEIKQWKGHVLVAALPLPSSKGDPAPDDP